MFKYVLAHPNATAPRKAHKKDAGYDVTAAAIEFSEAKQYCNNANQGLFKRLFCPTVIPQYVIVDTGLAIQPDEEDSVDTFTMAAANSRTAKRCMSLGNGIGVIDVIYTGTIKFIYKIESWATQAMIDEYFKVGNVVGQLIVTMARDVEWKKVDKLDDTERGTGGFGSTQKS